MRRVALRYMHALTLATSVLLATGAAASITPKSLLIYYSYPSLINGATTIAGAATEFGKYDYVVIGNLLEKTSHPDHANTVAILAHPSVAHTTVFGYINLGVSVENLPLSEIQLRVDEWQATGVQGIFFDLFGYDFGTSRARQNAAVDYAHSKGMPVVANAWVPDDAFGQQVSADNPSGAATSLGAADFYLSESHQIFLGQYDSESHWQTKANALQAFQNSLGFKILSVTTSDVLTPYSQNMFFYSWFSALLYAHEATGWGEYNYSANSSSAPFRARPAADPGEAFTSAVLAASPMFTRTTTLGTVSVDTAMHAAGFTPFPLAGFIPGGRGRNDCMLEWTAQPLPPPRNGVPTNVIACTDDDPSCDFGTAGDRACTFHLSMCFNVPETRFACVPTDVAQVRMVLPTASQRRASDVAVRAAIEDALRSLGASVQGVCTNRGPQNGQGCSTSSQCDSTPGLGDGLCRSVAVFVPPLTTQGECTAAASIKVPLRTGAPGLFRAGRQTVQLRAIRSGTPQSGDIDTLTLICNPQ